MIDAHKSKRRISSLPFGILTTIIMKNQYVRLLEPNPRIHKQVAPINYTIVRHSSASRKFEGMHDAEDPLHLQYLVLLIQVHPYHKKS